VIQRSPSRSAILLREEEKAREKRDKIAKEAKEKEAGAM
jgi:hypothetical protein